MPSFGQEAQEAPPPPHGQPPRYLQLTAEEEKVLAECRRKSIYRGIPASFITGLLVKYLVKMNSAPRFVMKSPNGFAIGMGLCAFGVGIGSYRSTCLQKILALENSQLADMYRAHMKSGGVQVGEKLGGSSEFQADADAPFTKPVDDDPFESVVNKRLGKLEEGKSWEDVRNESRRPVSQSRRPVSSPTSSDGTWNDIRMKNRANHGDHGLTPEEEHEFETKLNNRETSRESRSPSPVDEPNKEIERVEKTKTTYGRGFPTKNKYGDEIN